MGQLTLPLTIASTALSALGTQEQAENQQKQASYEAELRKRQYDRNQQKLAEQKKEVQATMRARMAAQGHGVNEGSSAALLNGLQESINNQSYQLGEDYNSGVTRSLLASEPNRYDRIGKFLAMGREFNRYF